MLAAGLQKELHLSSQEYSHVVNAFLIVYSIMYLLMGRVVDRLGTRFGLGLASFWCKTRISGRKPDSIKEIRGVGGGSCSRRTAEIVTHVGSKPFRARGCSGSGDEEHTSPAKRRGAFLKGGDYAAGRFLRDEDEVSRAAIRIRLLVSTAAPTNSSKRGRPWARQRFIPLPRKSTEIRPSMPARKRCPFLKAALFS